MIKIDLDRVNKLVKEADQIFFDPKAEETLVELLTIQQKIEDAIKEAKARLEKTALEINPNFTSIQSDKIKVFYRAYGSRFYLDTDRINVVDKDLYSKKVSYSINTKELNAWIKEKKSIPDGVIEAERKKSLSITIKNAKQI